MTLPDFDVVVHRVRTARGAEDLFGPDDRAAASAYRRMARTLHPDRVDAAHRAAATAAFARLAAMWHGRRDADVLVTPRGRYRTGPLRWRGDLANLYQLDDPIDGDRLLKVVRDPADNDLIEREARALRTLGERGDPRYLPYVPCLVESFRQHDPATGVQRRANILHTASGLRSLAEVRAAHPDGVDPRDAAWMWRRLLVALGFAHRAGVLHGAVLPEHVLIQPEQHGLVLVGWGTSTVDPADPVPAVVAARREWYPAEVLAKQPAGPGTDLAMAAGCLAWLMGEQAPDPLAAFAAGCQLATLRARPDDAWRLLAELDDVLACLYGPRTFRPFTL